MFEELKNDVVSRCREMEQVNSMIKELEDLLKTSGYASYYRIETTYDYRFRLMWDADKRRLWAEYGNVKCPLIEHKYSVRKMIVPHLEHFSKKIVNYNRRNNE